MKWNVITHDLVIKCCLHFFFVWRCTTDQRSWMKRTATLPVTLHAPYFRLRMNFKIIYFSVSDSLRFDADQLSFHPKRKKVLATVQTNHRAAFDEEWHVHDIKRSSVSLLVKSVLFVCPCFFCFQPFLVRSISTIVLHPVQIKLPHFRRRQPNEWIAKSIRRVHILLPQDGLLIYMKGGQHKFVWWDDAWIVFLSFKMMMIATV